MSKRFLITAGSTHEMIDKVRFWTNIFTGNTGLSIAKAVAQVGQVDLLTSNRSHIAELSKAQTTPHPIHAAVFTDHASLRQLLATKMQQSIYDAVFMSAAVSDYTPQRVFAILSRQSNPDDSTQQRWIVQDVQADKIKSSHDTIAITGTATEKLVDLFRSRWNHQGLLVKFKLEVGISPDELIRIGQASRKASGAEYLVANTLEMVQGPNPGAYLLSDDGSEFIPRAQLPARMLKLVK